jgi:tRNA threonylcarbamoyladenosine biosynthesis protein TsaB
MVTLALDTCLDACSAALRTGADRGRDRYERLEMSTGHAEALLPMIDRIVGAAGIRARDITHILVTHGPGTFTGTRIAIAAARAFALATGAEVASLSSLRLIGLAALERHPATPAVVVVSAARNGEVYAETVARDAAAPAAALTFAAAAERARTLRTPVIGTGSGDVAAAARAAGHGLVVLDGDELPDARALLDLGTDPGLLTASPTPLYLRPPDAKPPANAALPRSPA